MENVNKIYANKTPKLIPKIIFFQETKNFDFIIYKVLNVLILYDYICFLLQFYKKKSQIILKLFAIF
jgi:hypothetical protein